jgi:monofunctional biosynthetic peptidoglycan transglycosylase
MRRLLGWAVRVLLVAFVGTALLVLAFRFVAPPITSLMMLRAWETAARGHAVTSSYEWVPLEDVSPALLRAVVAAEDARFFTHAGVDAEAVLDAQEYNERHRGRRIHGGSTITMQCARSVFLWPGRTYVRKALEVYFGTLLEALWGKRRILEVYVNVVEWGDGVYGAEAAARRYFAIPARALTTEQAALLAAVLPNPRRWNPTAPTRYLVGRAATIRARAAAVRLDGLG